MFPRSQRLRRSHDIMTVLRRGHRSFHGPLTCYLYNADDTKLTVIVDKKVSKLSTVRNRLKRQLRAALHMATPPRGWVVVRANPGADKLSFELLSEHLTACLQNESRSR